MIDQLKPDPASATGHPASGCGAFLRQAREAAGLSLQQAGAELKMPLRVLQALEEENWLQSGAPVFVRGQLRSYARLLKVDIEPYLDRMQLHGAQPVELVSHSHTPQYQRVLESIARRAVYVVITAAIAVPVWLATRSQLGDAPAQATASLDLADAGGAPANNGTQATQKQAASPQQAAPYVASLTPPLSRNNGNALTLRMTGDSWVQINAADGRSIEQGTLKAGEERSFQKGDAIRVVLGNAAAVEVQQAGNIVDTTPYRRANVARFTVSSDGSLVPVAH
jgi:cytoskeleton protein RodZ